jgi:O-antigen/teichoic acid export membrane protein
LELGFGLNSLIVAASISLFITIIFLKYTKRDFLNSIEKSFDHLEQINWMKDIFPMQWKMGISWISGWLLFSSFVPISFKLIGPVEAGQMGMTLSMILGLASVSSMVVNAIAPKMAKYAAAKDRVALDRMISKAAKYSMIIYIFGSIIIILLSLYLELMITKYTGRLLHLEYLIYIIIGVGAQQFTMPITAYMFAYIMHPFVFESLLLGILTITSLYFAGIYFGIGGMTLSFMVVQVVAAVPIFLYKFWVFRRAIG